MCAYKFSVSPLVVLIVLVLTHSCNPWKIINKTGITNTPKMVPINIPPIAPVPIALFPTAPAPFANINGINPKINANDVIKIGRQRAVAP